MAWSAWTSFTQDTGVSDGSWTELGQVNDVNPRELVNIAIGMNNESGSVTDALMVRVIVSYDEGTNWTDAPIYQRNRLPDTVNEEWFAFVLMGYKDYRIETQSTGSTDDYTVDGEWRVDGVDA